MSEHLSSLRIDALALGRPDPEAVRHLEACARCRADADEAQRRRDHFDRSVVRRSAPLVSARAQRQRATRLLWLAPAVAAAVALALAIVLPRPREPDLRVKGGPGLHVFARRGEVVARLHDGEALAAGDGLRFVVEPAGLGYLLIASVDGAGHTTIYYPYGGRGSGRLAAEPRVELPGSIVLDDAPGPERVFALFSERPLSAGEVEAATRAIAAGGADAIRRRRALDLPAAQTSLLFEKVER